MDYSPPGSSMHGISQARMLEWVAIPFSRVSSQPRDWTQVCCIASRFFTIGTTRENIIFKLQKIKNEEKKVLKEFRREKHLTYRKNKDKNYIYLSSETMQARRAKWNIQSFERKNNLELCILWYYSSKVKKENKIFLRKTKFGGICCQWTCLTENVKRSSLERRKII